MTQVKPNKNDKKPKQKTPTASNDETMGEYFKGVRSEWDKISWPSRIQIWQLTMVVLATCTVFTLGIWLMDRIFAFVIELLRNVPIG